MRALEREVRTLIGRANIRPALNEITNGPVKIAEGGTLEVLAPDGTGIFGVGELWDGAYGTKIQRSDGTLAFNTGGSGEGSNMIRTFDRAGNVIVMDDYYTQRFLGRPWMPVPLYPTKQQGTESTNYQPAWVGGAPAHNAVMVLRVSSIASTGGGQVRVSMLPPSGGTVVLAEYDIPANTWTSKTHTWPLHNVDHLEYVGWLIEHRVKSSGAGIETRLFSSYTRNTFTADEAPDPPANAATAAAQTLTEPAPPSAEPPAETVKPGLHIIDD
ncbi:hypothetical protein [Streptomyces sp. TRM49041]|uniref:hypothetical protein n=1 Tax=Streptomyces sp. TRM49041 TaxID=2603216 RepID=UPI0011EFC31C|nr:hypothetical protein [Streptomyces sp. TRM49041]